MCRESGGIGVEATIITIRIAELAIILAPKISTSNLKPDSGSLTKHLARKMDFKTAKPGY